MAPSSIPSNRLTIRRLVAPVTAVVAAVLVVTVFPLFHVVPLEYAREQEPASVDPSGFAAAFWDERLPSAMKSADDASDVLGAIRSDALAAGKRFSRAVGISSSYYVFIQGIGRIVRVDEKGVYLAVETDSSPAEIVLPVGMVFGNTVRDATGLLDIKSFKNSQDFNDIAAALNRLVETRVLPRLSDMARIGVGIRFVGCAVVGRDEKRRWLLKVVPLQVDVVQPEQSR